MQNWAVIASEIINVAAAIVFILLFSLYLYKIKKHYSATQRFVRTPRPTQTSTPSAGSSSWWCTSSSTWCR